MAELDEYLELAVLKLDVHDEDGKLSSWQVAVLAPLSVNWNNAPLSRTVDPSVGPLVIAIGS